MRDENQRLFETNQLLKDELINILDKLTDPEMSEVNSRRIFRECQTACAKRSDVTSQSGTRCNSKIFDSNDSSLTADSLIGGKPVVTSGGGGGCDSDFRWDGRRPDEEEDSTYR